MANAWWVEFSTDHKTISRNFIQSCDERVDLFKKEIIIFLKKEFGICLPTKYSQIIGRYLPNWIDLNSYKLNRVQLRQ